MRRRPTTSPADAGPTDDGRLPPGYDQPGSDFFVQEGLRDHYLPPDSSEAYRLLFDPEHAGKRQAFAREVTYDQQERDWPAILERIRADQTIRGRAQGVRAAQAVGPHRLVRDENQRLGRPRTDAELAFARGDTVPADLHDRYLHDVALGRAAQTRDARDVQHAADELHLRLTTCESCGQRPPKPTPVAGVTGSLVGNAAGLPQLCQPCRLVIDSLRAGSASSDILDDTGRTRAQAATAWLDTITARPA
jgi:hypothetical protein